LLCLSIDIPAIKRLGPKAIIMFFCRNSRHYYRWPCGTVYYWAIFSRYING
jgi:hypothetical protein